MVTGAAGFIGAFLTKRLLETTNDQIVGVDNLNDYYDVSLKDERLKMLSSFKNFSFVKGDISDKQFIDNLIKQHKFDVVVNLAAQAGVRYSIDHPDVYIQSNIIGFYNIPTTGLRFFTVYGPMGRPDMAYFSFANKLVKGQTIEIFNYGNCKRDFTYVDDIVEGIVRVMQKPPVKKDGEDGLPIPPYKIYNIGNNKPENLLDFVNILSDELVRANVLPKDFDIKKHMKLVAMQKGDVPITYADTSDLERDFGYKPSTSLREGLRRFAEWYKSHHN